MRIVFAADHGGVHLKEYLINFVKEDYDCKDFGTYTEESVDYPDMALLVSEAVAGGEFDLGVLCCGTGIGVSVSANKVPGVRAALCHDVFSARMAREHNNANIITMGQRVIGPGLAGEVLKSFLNARFSGGRHARRVNKIQGIEKRYCNPR
ncbi:MAG: ribose 5-phosphate isomerase B [Clostridiales bacterium]|nr:ribose 5-phosphate isomerase B [Clostridiales bacterium]MCF8022544.1 ribose 5-phosphate isomerase B [Clostridiales bacterium]